MPEFWLLPHPGSPGSPIDEIKVEIWRRDNARFNISFYATGAIDGILWPGPASGRSDGAFVAAETGRTDGLWQHSCFEAFCSKASSSSYFEFNLATNGQWATYAFDGYRAGMRPAHEVRLIGTNWKRRPGRVVLHALADLPPDYADADWQFGISTVIEAKDGSKSFWALSHPSPEPDFHNADCFKARLAAPA